ncbi:BRO family protein [Flavobacterium poyangense]|nr:BRO family protein [Flavobacterium sp. JXAS1]
MGHSENIQLFEEKKMRTIWNEDEEKWYFSIVDVIGVLTDSLNARKYWSVLKTRLKKEGSELTTICSQLKMKSTDGKYYKTDVADTQQLFRLIQSVHHQKRSLLNYGLPYCRKLKQCLKEKSSNRDELSRFEDFSFK